MRGQPNITFDASDRGGVIRLRVSGELDIASGMALESRLNELRDAGARVRLDMSGLDFMDAAGLRALSRVTRSGGDWLEILPQVQPQVWRMLTITQSEQVLSPA